MKTSLIFFFTIFLCSCAATTFTEVNKSDGRDEPFPSILVIPYFGNEHLTFLNADYYEHQIYFSLTSIESMKMRKHLGKAISKILLRNREYLSVMRSSDIFEDEEYYSFIEFKDRIKQAGVEGVLFVRIGDFWQTTSLATNIWGAPVDDVDNNVIMYSYLIPTDQLDKPIYISEITVKGTYMSSYDVLNNHFARKLKSRLLKNNFIPFYTTSKK